MCALGQAQMYVDKGVQQLEKAKVSQKSARKVSSPRPHCKNPHKRQPPPLPRFPMFGLPGVPLSRRSHVREQRMCCLICCFAVILVIVVVVVFGGRLVQT